MYGMLVQYESVTVSGSLWFCLQYSNWVKAHNEPTECIPAHLLLLCLGGLCGSRRSECQWECGYHHRWRWSWYCPAQLRTGGVSIATCWVGVSGRRSERHRMWRWPVTWPSKCMWVSYRLGKGSPWLQCVEHDCTCMRNFRTPYQIFKLRM